MESLLSTIIIVILNYFVAKDVLEKNEGIDVNPLYYAIGGLLIGLLPLLYLLLKVRNFKKYHK